MLFCYLTLCFHIPFSLMSFIQLMAQLFQEILLLTKETKQTIHRWKRMVFNGIIEQNFRNVKKKKKTSYGKVVNFSKRFTGSISGFFTAVFRSSWISASKESRSFLRSSSITRFVSSSWKITCENITKILKSQFGPAASKRMKEFLNLDVWASHRIYLIKRPGRLLNFGTLRVGAYSGWALIKFSLFSASSKFILQQNSKS